MCTAYILAEDKELQKEYKVSFDYFDDSSHVHNIVQTAFLCAKCENTTICEIGMRFMSFFTKLAPLKIISITSKLYRVKDRCKFLKGRFDEFINDLNSI